MQVRSAVFALALVASAFSPALAEEPASSDVTLNGYYRVRGLFLRDPDLDPQTQPNAERYFQHRIRLEPHVFVNEYLSLHAQADAFDDQIWGANTGNVLSQSTEDRTANIVLKRAYGEVKTEVGVFRVGRMGSNWGKGLLSNDGEGFRNEFGDAHGGDTYDRILFATKPLGKDGPLTTALIYDKIIESEYAGAATAARLKGDVDEFGLVVHYKKDWLTAGVYGIYRTQSKTSTTALIPDVYLAVETEKFHADLEAVAINGSTSGVTGFFVPDQVIQGKKVAKFTFAQPKTDINMLGAVSEIGYRPLKSLDLALEAGYASGDKPGTDAFDDGELSAFSFDTDYNVGLIMFEYANRVRTERELASAYKKFRTNTSRLGGKTLTEVCAQMCVNNTDFATAAQAQDDFLGTTATAFLPSNGAVKNAFYLFPKVRFQPIDELKMIAGLLWAKAPEAIATRQTIDDAATGYITETDLRFNYGIELDYGINYQYTENFGLGLQAGYFHPGAVFERENGDQAADIYAIQPRFTVTF
jgi:hypothetical protein